MLKNPEINMLLETKYLRVQYKQVEVLRGVDLKIKKGECLGLVGESGCGKTTLGLSLTRLISERKGASIKGSVLFNGEDILTFNNERLRGIRGRKISYVFQEPFSSLNPVFTIYEQIKEILPDGCHISESISDVLESVGLPKDIGMKNKKVYPHELSGGMQQRVMIAMAIVCRPDLLVLDEPTTALDVTIQNQILKLIMDLKNKIGLSILFISHDLRIVFRLADRIGVMYSGKIVEECPKEEIISRPAHPYTIGLINSIPSLGHRKERFNAIDGKMPLFSNLPQGCKFYPRCRLRVDKCTEKEPELEDVSDRGEHFSRCIRMEEIISL